MGQLLFFLSKLKFTNGSVAKASFNLQQIKSVKFKKKRPETKWSMHEQAEVCRNCLLRAELTSVAKDGDDLCIGVKG